MLSIILGTTCIIYFVILLFYSGLKSKFPIIWLVTGMTIILKQLICAWMKKIQFELPPDFMLVIYSGAVLLFVIFLISEVAILFGMHTGSKEKAEILIILGAQMNQDGPSKILKKRLDCAVNYARRNRDIEILVTGGKGKNEPITEASGMIQYLIENGIAKECIIIEDCSFNTYENFIFSKKILGEMKIGERKIGIVTTNFHMFRSQLLAKKAGYRNTIPIPAQCDKVLFVNYMVREALALIKDWMSGRL